MNTTSWASIAICHNNLDALQSLLAHGEMSRPIDLWKVVRDRHTTSDEIAEFILWELLKPYVMYQKIRYHSLFTKDALRSVLHFIK
jgi:hypothetical protein